MKVVSLILTAMLATPAMAYQSNQEGELRTALTNLSKHVEVQNRSIAGRAQRLGLQGTAAALAGSIAMYVTKQPVSVVNFGVSILKISAVTWAAGHLAPLIVLKIKGRTAESFRTAEQLNLFFALPLGTQFKYASQDPELADFILGMNRSYQEISRAVPGVGAFNGIAR